MVSLWTLLYMLTKATSVDGESDGREVSDGCSTAHSHHSSSVTMETAEQSQSPTDCEVEVAADDSPGPATLFSAEDEVCSGTECPAPPGAAVGSSPTDESAVAAESGPGGPGGPGGTAGPRTSSLEPGPALVSDSGHEELNRNESVTSSVSDSPSSADSVYENEALRKRQDTPEQDPDPDPEPGPEPQHHPDHLQQDPETGNSPLIEPEPEPELEPDPDPEQYPMPDLYPEPEQDPDLMLDPQTEEDPDLDSYPHPEPDPDLDLFPHPEPDPDLDLFPYPEPDPDLDLYPDPELGLYPDSEFEAGDSNLNLNLHPEAEGYQILQVYPDEDPDAAAQQSVLEQSVLEQSVLEQSVLEQCIRAEALSDGSNESVQDPEGEEALERLTAEMAAASSDEETDEKWRTIFSSSINKEDDDSYLDSLQLSAQDLFVQKVEVTDFAEQDDNDFEEVSFEVPQVEEVLEQPEDVISFPVPPQEVKYNPLGLQGLSKISEDDSENGRDAAQNQAGRQQRAASAENAKKLPKDFCVIQETKSENVSMEHVDFELARRQWRQMEEQTKNKAVLPVAKQPSFHGGHSFMYTPVRNIERTHRKAQELESLSLGGEFPHAQFSPCSEDSGLDDSSYRSPNDEPETPVEREIRISLEREENFKRERGISRMGKSTDCAPSRGMPRSISTPLTPSFIITSSPTREPLKRDLSANNAVVVDPDGDPSSGPRQGKDSMAEWRSEDGSSNLIILETSNLIIRSASEFSLSTACEQPQEKMFLNNPFFKLRSRSSISLVDEEIKMVKQREEELKKEREKMYGAERSNRLDTLSFGHSVDVPMKCKSSPSSPMKTAYRMDRSALSCDHRFPDVYSGGRRKSAMALRWEAGEFTKSD